MVTDLRKPLSELVLGQSLVHFTSWFLQGSLSRIKALLLPPARGRRLTEVLDCRTGDVVTPALVCHSSPIHGRHAEQGRHEAVSGERFITAGKKKLKKKKEN